jgi:hypothetical protein
MKLGAHRILYGSMEPMGDLMVRHIEAELRHTEPFRIKLLLSENTHLGADNPEMDDQRLEHIHYETCQDPLVLRTPQIPMTPVGLPATVYPWSDRQTLTTHPSTKGSAAVENLKEIAQPHADPFLEYGVASKGEQRMGSLRGGLDQLDKLFQPGSSSVCERDCTRLL